MAIAHWLCVRAPATIGNFGVGFDTLGAAVLGVGDVVAARHAPAGAGVRVVRVTGLSAGIPVGPGNTAAIAAREVLRRLGERGGLDLVVNKGLPPGSGLGSSAASAVAGAVAADAVCGGGLSREALVECATAAEAEVSGGWFADNTAPAVFGGLCLVVSRRPLRVIPLGAPAGVHLALATPAVHLLTRRARAVLPSEVPLTDAVFNLARVAQVVAAFARGDASLLAGAIEDRLVEPYRARLVPGFRAVQAAALEAGALGCTLSGAGPTVFAVALDAATARRAARAMAAAFRGRGVACRARMTAIDPKGARVVGRRRCTMAAL